MNASTSPALVSTSLRAGLLGLALASLTACGGKGAAPASPGPDPVGEGDGGGGGAALDKAAVQNALAAMAVPDACGGADSGDSLGAVLDAQAQLLGEPNERSFDCREGDGGGWSCTWSVFSTPSGTPDPDDPCAEGGASGYQIMVEVDAGGAIVPDSVFCNAPG